MRTRVHRLRLPPSAVSGSASHRGLLGAFALCVFGYLKFKNYFRQSAAEESKAFSREAIKQKRVWTVASSNFDAIVWRYFLNGSVAACAPPDEKELKKWIADVDVLLKDSATDKQKLFDMIKSGKEKYGPQPDIMWRLAKATHLLAIAAQKAGNKQLKKELASLTLDVAKSALEADDKNFECHKWYAVAVSSMGDYVSTKERILDGHTVRKHVDIALNLKPEDATLHHMLGRWCYEIAKLSWIERQIASTLFAKVPESTYEEAAASFLKAYAIDPKWKENILHVALTYVAMSKYSEAIKWVDKGLALDNRGEDDHLAHDKLVELSNKYSGYRL